MVATFDILCKNRIYIVSSKVSQIEMKEAAQPQEPRLSKFDGAIGIDLGTTFSCVCVFVKDAVHVIPNDRGERTTPSCVAIHNGEVLVGGSAYRLAACADSGAAFDAKRMIGRHFSEPAVQGQLPHWPFRVVPHTEGSVEDEIRIALIDKKTGKTHEWSPETVSAHVLKYLKSCAEKYLGAAVHWAVVTVPAYFNDAQRERTKVAASMAGLKVLRLVNEPTAAALAYGLHEGLASSSQPSRDVLVFDFGGGTFDVSVISVLLGSSFEVRATNGDTHLGGRDIDAAIQHYVEKQLPISVPRPLERQSRLYARMVTAVEKAKCELSFALETEIVLESALPGDEDFSFTLTRAKLEEICAPFFSRCFTIMKKALADAKIEKSKLSAVVLVGGSSRIPKLAESLTDFFSSSTQLCRSVHPDEAVGMGAAIQAAILSSSSEQQSTQTESMLLLDILPLSIGIDVDEGRMDVIIPRNTTIPYRATKEYTTVEDGQQAVDIVIFEGEHRLTNKNHRLGEFSLEGIASAPKGEPTIVVTFSVDADGILTVTAVELSATESLGKELQSKTLTVKADHRLSRDQIEKMIREGDVSLEREPDEDCGRSPLTPVVEHTRLRLQSELAAVQDLLAVYDPGTISSKVATEVQRRIKFLPHAKEWIENQLHLLTDEQEVVRKEQKITILAKKAVEALKNAMEMSRNAVSPVTAALQKRPREESLPNIGED